MGYGNCLDTKARGIIDICKNHGKTHMDECKNSKLHSVAESGRGLSIALNVYCRLFSDNVPMQVCMLRKEERDVFAWNACSGCAAGRQQHRSGPRPDR